MNKFTRILSGVLTIALISITAKSYAANGGSNNTAGCPTITVTLKKQINCTCNGLSNGEAIVNASGGVSPYTYSWSPSGGTKDTALNLAAGTYTVTAKDFNGCTGTLKVTITQPVVLTAKILGVINVPCYGTLTGAILSSGSGGTSPYTYSWAPSGGTGSKASSLAAGTYTVTVNDKNGCGPVTTTATITQPATALTATVTPTPESCNAGSNGAASVTASGGSPSYTYSWSDGKTTSTISSLTIGTYSVTAKDKNGCTTVASGTVTQPAAFSMSTTKIVNPTCGSNNGELVAKVTGGTAPYAYSWAPSGGTNDTALSLSAGMYTLTVTDANGCIGSSVFLLDNFNFNPTVTGSNVTCYNGNNGTSSITLTGGKTPYAYSWSSGQTTSSVSGLSAGVYYVSVTDANGCHSYGTRTITQPSQFRDSISAVTDILCSGSSTGKATAGAKGGTAPYKYSWSDGATTSSISSIAAGSYTCTMSDKNGCSPTPATVVATITQPATFTASITSSNSPLCNGNTNGNITVSVTGGTSPYTYNWSPSGGTSASATNLGSGSYTCTVTDKNSCTTTVSTTLTNPALLTASITSSTNPTCGGGGSATVTAGGGTGAYSYSWSPSGGTNATASGLLGGSYTVTVTDANGCSATANVTLTSPSTLTASITSSTNPTCSTSSDGSATVTASGGVSPYTYSWSPSGGTNSTASSLPNGTYIVTVTDNTGCEVIASVTLSTSAVSATITTSTNPLCNGNNGSATVSASGGNSPYTYSWSPSGGAAATASLPAGNYTVTVTDKNGCTGTATTTISQPSLLTAAITASVNPLCNGDFNGYAVVTGTGGTGAYSYSWSPSGTISDTASALAAGSYTATVTDANGCTANANTTLTNPAPVTASITSSSNPLCNGGSTGSATVTAGGGTSPYTYSWTPAGGTNATASGLTAGSYTVNVTDNNGCGTSANITLTDPLVLTAAISSSSNPLCNGGSNGSATVTAGGGTGSYTYSWAPSGGNAATASGLAAGSYTVTVTDANGCTATANVTLTEPTAISASISSSTDPLCNGGSTGSATVSASGGTGALTYSWAPSGGNAATASGLAAGSYTVTVTDANGCTATANVTLTDPAALTASITSSTNPTCSVGGSATVTAGGGTGAYTYSWSPSGGTGATASGLAAGSYTVTVTDANGCTATANVTLTSPSTVTGTISSSDPLCNGGSTGSATVTASGGLAPYTYSWAPSGGTNTTASGLAAGNYTVTITDANSCTGTATVTLTDPAALTASITSSNPLCNGTSTGSATVTAAGGTGADTYSWAPSGGTAATANGLAAGSYTVTVTDANGCTTTASATLTDPAVLLAAITSSSNPLCSSSTDGMAAVTASGGTGAYTYSWAPSGGTGDTASGLGAGSYTVTVTDANGCTATANTTLTAPSALTASITSSVNPTCSTGGGAKVVATGGTGAYTYNWAPSGGTTDSAGGLLAGSYTVTVTDANGCTTTASVTLTNSSAPSITFTTVSPSCFGGTNGSITANVTGGTAPYTYSWAPGLGTSNPLTGLPAGSYTCTVTDNTGCSGIGSVTLTQPAAITDSLVVTNVTCNGNCNGIIGQIVSGGTAPYVYSWTNGEISLNDTMLCAGAYTVTITDANGCTGTASAIVIQPTALVVSVTSVTNVTCNGGSDGCATVSVSGGTSPYTYFWSSGSTAPSACNLSAGVYTVTVTDMNNCTAIDTVVVTQPIAIVVTQTSVTNAACGKSNGAASVSASGGAGSPYTYSWSPSGGTSDSATSLLAGTYTVTATDKNGCTGTLTIIIKDSSSLAVTFSSSTNVTCNGMCNGSITPSVTGGTPAYIFSWSTGATTSALTNLCAGFYTVSVTDAKGCVATDTLTITQPAPLTVAIDSIINAGPGCNDTIWAVVTGGTMPYTYAWMPSGTSDSLTAICAGSYSVTVTDKNGCTIKDSVVIVTGINELSYNEAIKVYPVPTSGNIYISITEQGMETQMIEIFDITGREVMNEKVSPNSNLIHMDVSNLSNGTYLLKVVGNNGQRIARISVSK